VCWHRGFLLPRSPPSERRFEPGRALPEISFWQLVFVNARLFFVGSDDVPPDAKIEATRDINNALEAGWQGLDIAEIVPLIQIARAHELVEHPAKLGRVIVAIT
jgi:NADPH:quinone reductase